MRRRKRNQLGNTFPALPTCVSDDLEVRALPVEFKREVA